MQRPSICGVAPATTTCEGVLGGHNGVILAADRGHIFVSLFVHICNPIDSADAGAKRAIRHPQTYNNLCVASRKKGEAMGVVRLVLERDHAGDAISMPFFNRGSSSLGEVCWLIGTSFNESRHPQARTHLTSNRRGTLEGLRNEETGDLTFAMYF